MTNRALFNLVDISLDAFTDYLKNIGYFEVSSMVTHDTYKHFFIHNRFIGLPNVTWEIDDSVENPAFRTKIWLIGIDDKGGSVCLYKCTDVMGYLNTLCAIHNQKDMNFRMIGDN